MRAATLEVRELRRDIRHWRRGRVTVRWIEVISDAYIALFATLVLGSMGVSMVVSGRRAVAVQCTAAGCQEARSAMPWLVGVTMLLIVASSSRLFGPVFASAAANSWLLPAPIDRSAIFRPRLLRTSVAAFLIIVPIAAAAASLSGFDPRATAAFGMTVAVLSVAVVTVAVFSQARGGRLTASLTISLGLVLWIGLVLIALNASPLVGSPDATPVWSIGIGAASALIAVLMVRAVRDLGELRQRDVSRGGKLAPALSGALAGLDLALAYDVLLGNRWAARSSVRPRRGGPRGPAALVGYDVVRMIRSPEGPILLFAGVVVAYATEVAGGGRVVVPIAALVGFLAGLRLLPAMRVLCRTPSISRVMPFSTSTSRAMTLVVPAACLSIFGLASAPALHHAVGGSSSQAVLLGVAVAASSLTAATRWMTGRPPDYGRPLVSTPAGAVPTNLYGSVVRGFDVLLLTTGPTLILPIGLGSLVSIGLSLGVLSYFVFRH